MSSELAREIISTRDLWMSEGNPADLTREEAFLVACNKVYTREIAARSIRGEQDAADFFRNRVRAIRNGEPFGSALSKIIKLTEVTSSK